MILERMCNSIKSCTKKALVAGILFGSIFAATGYNKDIGYNIPAEINKLNELSSPNNKSTVYNKNVTLNPLETIAAPTITSKPDINELYTNMPDANDVNEPFFSAKEIDEINKIFSDTDTARKNPPFVTTVYGEAGYYNGAVNENPMLLNVTTSYNIFDKSPDEGALLLIGRALAKGDKSENFWNNHLDIGAGIGYQKDSIILGLEGVHREYLRKENRDSRKEGARLWAGYWSIWELKELDEIETFQNRVWGTNNLQFDYNTLEKNAVADFRADINLDLLNIGDFVIGPFVKGKINYDAKDEPWCRFGEVGGGIRIRNGPFSIFFESGNRGGRDRGSYNTIYGGVWFPIIY